MYRCSHLDVVEVPPTVQPPDQLAGVHQGPRPQPGPHLHPGGGVAEVRRQQVAGGGRGHPVHLHVDTLATQLVPSHAVV